jgi:hypothetical protein
MGLWSLYTRHGSEVFVEIRCLMDQWLFRSIGGWDVDVLSICIEGGQNFF